MDGENSRLILGECGFEQVVVNISFIGPAILKSTSVLHAIIHVDGAVVTEVFTVMERCAIHPAVTCATHTSVNIVENILVKTLVSDIR